MHNLAALQLLSATQQLVLIRQQAFHGEIKRRIIDSMHLLLCGRGTPTCIKEKDCELDCCAPRVQMSNLHLSLILGSSNSLCDYRVHF